MSHGTLRKLTKTAAIAILSPTDDMGLFCPKCGEESEAGLRLTVTGMGRVRVICRGCRTFLVDIILGDEV